MNILERNPSGGKEAKVEFLDGDFRIVRPGTFVTCATTGQPIPIEELRYWDVALQEAYSSPAALLERRTQSSR